MSLGWCITICIVSGILGLMLFVAAFPLAGYLNDKFDSLYWTMLALFMTSIAGLAVATCGIAFPISAYQDHLHQGQTCVAYTEQTTYVMVGKVLMPLTSKDCSDWEKVGK